LRETLAWDRVSDTAARPPGEGCAGLRSHIPVSRHQGASDRNPLHPRSIRLPGADMLLLCASTRLPLQPRKITRQKAAARCGSGCSLRSPTWSGQQLRKPARCTKMLPVAGSVRNASVSETAARTSGSAWRRAIGKHVSESEEDQIESGAWSFRQARTSNLTRRQKSATLGRIRAEKKTGDYKGPKGPQGQT
jgi:hypothetical protein